MGSCSILEKLSESIGGGQLRLGGLRKGRLKDLLISDVYTLAGGLPYRVASLAIFCGRPPYYKPWIEVFNINPVISGERGQIIFLSSPLEARLLDAVSNALSPGERVFIEYYRDEETLIQLENGVPVIASRLGYELYKRGFTWFKVWYYPEGFNEGGQKIQAEKPVDDLRRREHLKEHLKELRGFLGRIRIPPEPEVGLALSRARRLVREIESLLR